jgi:hypothetical protein
MVEPPRLIRLMLPLALSQYRCAAEADSVERVV